MGMGMGMGMDAAKLLKDKKFWFASFLIAWAAALQGHMMWMQKQDAFKEKFGDPSQKTNQIDGQTPNPDTHRAGEESFTTETS